jgi:hypothetical protein
VRFGFACQDCGAVVWLAQGPQHLRWLSAREHVVREVAEHSSSGVDLWMSEGLQFLDDHRSHDVIVVNEKEKEKSED